MKKVTSILSASCMAMLLGAVPAYAADLGGDCCADLEERIAELEATAVRKGNRKVSLKLSGHVNEAVLYWDDGVETNTYVGTSNYSRTRFRLTGSAVINTDWSAGYAIEIGVRRNSFVTSNQRDNGGTTGLDVRHQYWWLKSKTLGQLKVGRTSSASDGITEINLGGYFLASGNDPLFTHGLAFFSRRNGSSVASNVAGGFLGWGDLLNGSLSNAGEGDRTTGIHYVSPTLLGFTASASFAEDDLWDVGLRYAGQAGDFRLAAGVAYQQWGDSFRSCAGRPAAGPGPGDATPGVDCESIGASASIMHTPTGLFLSGSYGYIEDNGSTGAAGTRASGRDEHWYIAGGINKKFVALGKTALFVDYMNYDGASTSTLNTSPTSGVRTTVGGFNLTGTNVTQLGVGIVQSIDAASMDLYLSYHRFEADVSTTGGNIALDNLDTVMAGARITF